MQPLREPPVVGSVFNSKLACPVGGVNLPCWSTHCDVDEGKHLGYFRVFARRFDDYDNFYFTSIGAQHTCKH